MTPTRLALYINRICVNYYFKIVFTPDSCLCYAEGFLYKCTYTVSNLGQRVTSVNQGIQKTETIKIWYKSVYTQHTRIRQLLQK